MEKIKHSIDSEAGMENIETQINMRFGALFEEKRTKETLSILEWLIDNGYKPILPKGIDKNSNEEQIKEQIKKEYDQAEYEKISKKLQDDFSEVGGSLQQTLIDIFGENITAVYDVLLTKYGVGGSFGMPNKVALNLNNKLNNKNGIKTIVHEIIHLIVEENVQKYKLEHFEKERLVDLILNSEKFSFLKYDHWQKGYRGAEEYVDDIFNKHFFESQEKFFTEIENARKNTSDTYFSKK